LDTTVIRYTRFISASSPAKVADRISEVIHTMGGKTVARENFKIKAQFDGNSFIAQVFADPKEEKQVVVDFRKKVGSAVEFRNLYQEIRAQLADIVLQPKSTTTTETDTTDEDMETS